MGRWESFDEEELEIIYDALVNYSSGDPELQSYELIIQSLLDEIDNEEK